MTDHMTPAAARPDAADRPIRVLLVDDHAVVRRGLRTFFELTDDIEVVGEAADGVQAVAEARRLMPDVILMDLLMPNIDGLGAIAAVKTAQPEIEIVAVTSFIEEDKVTAALEAGATGYLLKDAEAEEVADAVRAAYAGEMHLDPAVARLLARRLRERRSGAHAGGAADRARARGPVPRRTGRQQQGDRERRSSSPSARRGRTSATSWASSGCRVERRRRCGRSSTSWCSRGRSRRRSGPAASGAHGCGVHART